jgi:hypothetical protein
MAKKTAPKFQRKPRVRKKVPKHIPRKAREDSWMASGFDISMQSIAGAAVAYDAVLKKMKGPAFVICRWERGDHYFERLKEAVNARNFITDLQAELKIMVEPDNVFIAQEEPWPSGRKLMGNSSSLKQQAEISGAFLGGLLKAGFTEIFQIPNWQWRQIVADGLGITIHWTKYGKGVEGKMRSKEWALLDHQWPNEIPDWTDLINSKDGLKPRPDGSKARAVQPDDRYDALAVMTWMHREVVKGLRN